MGNQKGGMGNRKGGLGDRKGGLGNRKGGLGNGKKGIGDGSGGVGHAKGVLGNGVGAKGDRQEWQDVAEGQAGVITRAQLLGLGFSARQARRWLDSGRWRQAYPGVYLTFTGPVDDLAKVWAAVLSAGAGAVASHWTALWLFGAIAEWPEPLEVCVPHRRRMPVVPDVRVRRRRDFEDDVHPVARPPRIRLERAVLDLAEAADDEEAVVDVVLRVIQQRLTTAERLSTQLRRTARHRRRSLLLDVLSEVAEGITTVLELRYARDVERAHGLPRGRRNQPEGEPGQRRYRDVRYKLFALLIELDGLEAHPPHEAFRDLRRDNATVLAGDRVLRYGWRDVAGRPCKVADQVAVALRAHGWQGRPRRCGPACTIAGPT